MHIAIVGGGAAGIMAAAAIIETYPKATVTLIDKNDGLGKKVLISGGGRCNVTTGLEDIREILTKYPRGGKFLNSVMRRFPPQEIRRWFEAHDVPLKMEADRRVFPRSNDGRDIVGVFERLFTTKSVRLRLRDSVTQITRQGRGFVLRLKAGEEMKADKVILTTGGQAFRHTGSTGDGYAFAEALGHRITPLAPSLSGLLAKDVWIGELAGLPLTKATLRTKLSKSFEFTGPILMTHRGITGPAVFAMSSLVAFEKFDAKNPMILTVDAYPNDKADDLHRHLTTCFRHNAKKSLLNALDMLMPKSLAGVACYALNLNETKRCADVSNKDIRSLVTWLKGIPLTIIGRDAGEEFVTAGGVDLNEVDQRTMESKITPGLFFAGEILDIDGFTGGFNLQASWATGRAAGEACGIGKA